MALSSETLKKTACQAIDGAVIDLKDLADKLWQNPELHHEETFAHQLLSDYLEKRDFSVQRNYILKTAFKAVHTHDKSQPNLPNIAVLCEYDALPEIGHACGHNLIAEVGIGAAIGIRAAMDVAKAAGRQLGTLTVLGTPAEERKCGKAPLIKGGALEGIDAALMAHPTHRNESRPVMIALTRCDVVYTGKASHAAAFPWKGVNALDAAVLAYNSLAVLRQQMRPEWRLHAIISGGGASPNIIPEKASLDVFIRTTLTSELLTLKEKVQACFRGAAIATSCQLEVRWDENTYEHLVSNDTLASLYEKNADSVGFEHTFPNVSSIRASSDIGNVSQRVPTIHPMFYIGHDAVNHTREFAEASGNPRAQEYTLTVAKLLAMTAIDVFWSPQLLADMKADLAKDMENLQ